MKFFMDNYPGSQTLGETLHVMTYELGRLVELHHKSKRYGPQGYLNDAKKEMSDLISMCRMYCEQRDWNFEVLLKFGEEAYLERMEDLKRYGLLLPAKPRVICLCGSTRFTDQMLVKQWELTKQGFIVLGWCALPDSYFSGGDKAHIGDHEGVKELVDEVYKRKIDLSDEVLVMNIGGYIGESTGSEIDYALSKGKQVKYVEGQDVISTKG